jgi:hypothetical protein
MEAHASPPASYRKMKVLRPRQAVALDDSATRRAEATALSDCNPMVNAMAETKAEMRNILDCAGAATHQTTLSPARKRLDTANVQNRKESWIPASSASSSAALYTACLHRLPASKALTGWPAASQLHSRWVATDKSAGSSKEVTCSAALPS